MENKSFSFSTFNDYAYYFISDALNDVKNKRGKPVVVCIGSDLVLGDSLGPLTGTMLKRKNADVYVYGVLNNPVTAKEIPNINERLKKTHPNSPILSIDAAVGDKDDVGTIRIFDKGIKPGLGVNKDLERVGDYSIIGVVADKTNKNTLLRTRLNLVYKMADQISNAVLRHVGCVFERQNA